MTEVSGSPAVKLDSPSVWTGKARATVSITGPNSLKSDFEGSFALTVYLAPNSDHATAQDKGIPINSVLGRLAGGFETHASKPGEELSGSGSVSYFVGGTYDPASENIRIGVHTAGMEATGNRTLLGDPSSASPPTKVPLAVNWNTGRRSAMDDAYENLPTKSIMLEPPKPPTLDPTRSGDLLLLESVPQTKDLDGPPIVLDLKNPSLQTVTQTYDDEAMRGSRVTTWTFVLTPIFEIERDSSPYEAGHSFLSTDQIAFHISIPGVNVAGSQWERLASWSVSGQGPSAGNGVPGQGSKTATFSFRPNPSNRPTGGSFQRNRPLSYRVSATLEGTTQHYFLIQDEVDILRQEYIDHNESIIPSRSDCVAHQIDNTFNVGNYNLFVDGGMQAAFDKVSLEFRRESQSALRVVSGFRSPQRNKGIGDAHPGNPHVYGRALDLVTGTVNPDTLKMLYQACVRAGYHTICESAPGKAVPPESPDTKQVHIDW